jgi:hypothetical protein
MVSYPEYHVDLFLREAAFALRGDTPVPAAACLLSQRQQLEQGIVLVTSRPIWFSPSTLDATFSSV